MLGFLPLFLFLPTQLVSTKETGFSVPDSVLLKLVAPSISAVEMSLGFLCVGDPGNF